MVAARYCREDEVSKGRLQRPSSRGRLILLPLSHGPESATDKFFRSCSCSKHRNIRQKGALFEAPRTTPCAILLNGCEVSGSITWTLNQIMMALTQPNIIKLGVYGTSDVGKGRVVESITRRVTRDNLFDVVVKASVMKKPDLKRIQGELGNMLALQLHKKTLQARARLLCDRIKTVEKILIILDDLWGEINLGRIGIPFGNDHKGCKILLLSESREVLSNQMNTQLAFSV